jgi:hypothetical protein
MGKELTLTMAQLFHLPETEPRAGQTISASFGEASCAVHSQGARLELCLQALKWLQHSLRPNPSKFSTVPDLGENAGLHI